MDALTLNKWTRFAEKGGIGKAVGRHDVLASGKGDLMFMKDEIIVVLKVLSEGEDYLGSCEGVIGRFQHEDVTFSQKQLKRPVFVPHKKNKPSQSIPAEETIRDSPKVMMVPPQIQVDRRDEHEIPRQRSTTSDSVQTVCLPAKYSGGRSRLDDPTPTTTETFASSAFSPDQVDRENMFSPVFHAQPLHSRQIPGPIIIPPSLRIGSHVSLTASQPGTANSFTGTMDSSEASADLDSPVERGLGEGLGEISWTSNDSGWEAKSERSSMDVYVEVPTRSVDLHRDGSGGSGSDVETPTLKAKMDVPQSTMVSPNDKHSEPLQIRPSLNTSNSASSTSTSASFEFKAHASFRASNPFALDTSGSFSGSERTSSPGIRSPTNDIRVQESASVLGIAAHSVNPPHDLHLNDDDEDDSPRRSMWDDRMGLTSPVQSDNESDSGFTRVSGSGINDPPSVVQTSKQRESSPEARTDATGTFGRAGLATGLASQIRAKLVVGPAQGSQRGRQGWDTPSPIPFEAPARPAMRRIESERNAKQVKRQVVAEMTSSQSQPALPQNARIASPSSDSDSSSSPSREVHLLSNLPKENNHTISDIFSDYRNIPENHSGPSPMPDRNSMARRSQSMGAPASRPALKSLSEATGTTESACTAHSQRGSAAQDGWTDTGHGQEHTIYTNPSSASASTLSCVSTTSALDQILMTPQPSAQGGQVLPRAKPFGFGDQPVAESSVDQSGENHVSNYFGDRTASEPGSEQELRPDETSVGATAIARRKRAFTLRGETSTELSKARNPVPIRFLVGDAGSYQSPASPRHGRAVTSPEASLVGGKENPGTAFFPKEPLMMPTNSFTRTEVPLPLHQSPSTQSIVRAYNGIDVEVNERNEQYNNGGETIGPMLQIRNSVRKRSLSLKRSQPQLRVETSVTTVPIPISRVKSESRGGSSPSTIVGLRNLPSRSSFSISSRRPKASLVGSLSEASPISSKDFFKVEHYNDTKFTMNDGIESRKPSATHHLEETDEWGFVGNSPVPSIYTTKRADPKAITKVEQNVLSIVNKPLTTSSAKKVGKIVWEQSVPLSLRWRVWNWVQPSSRVTRGPKGYRVIADQVVVPVRRDEDLPLYPALGTHRALIKGTFPIQEMVHVYACRRLKASTAYDTTWIAALFLSQAFDTEQAYWLYEGFMDRLHNEIKPIAIRVGAVVLSQLLSQHDPHLAGDLEKKGFDITSFESLVSQWYPSLFACTLPFPTALRVLDLLLLEGPSLLVRIALAMISILSKRLVAAQTKDEVLQQLLQPPFDELLAPEHVVRVTAKVAVSDRMLEAIKSKALTSLANQKRHA